MSSGSVGWTSEVHNQDGWYSMYDDGVVDCVIKVEECNSASAGVGLYFISYDLDILCAGATQTWAWITLGDISCNSDCRRYAQSVMMSTAVNVRVTGGAIVELGYGVADAVVVHYADGYGTPQTIETQSSKLTMIRIGDASSIPHLEMHKTSEQTISSAASVLWSNIHINQGGFVLTNSSSSFVVPQDGIYAVVYELSFICDFATTNGISAWIRKNDNPLRNYGQNAVYGHTAGFYGSLIGSALLPMSAGDFVTIFFQNDDGESTAVCRSETYLSCEFMMAKISEKPTGSDVLISENLNLYRGNFTRPALSPLGNHNFTLVNRTLP